MEDLKREIREYLNPENGTVLIDFRLASQPIHCLKSFIVSVGFGVALMPEMTLVDNTPRSTIVIPISDSKLTRTVGVIYPADRNLLPTEELFYDFLIETYERLNEI